MTRLTAALVSLIAVACGDGADDAAGGGGAAPGVDPFCATRPQLAFCEDFDAQALPGAFSESETENASLGIDEEDFASAPHSLRVTTVGDASAPGTAVLRQRFETGTRLRLFAQVLWPSSAQTGEAEVGWFEIGDDYRLGFGIGSDGNAWTFEEAAGDRRRVEGTMPLKRDEWVSVRWDVNIEDGGVGTGLLRFGNDTAIDVDDSSPPTSGAAPSVVIGLAASTAELSVAFDNVTVEIEDP